jgi:anti-anti-sigma factor
VNATHYKYVVTRGEGVVTVTLWGEIDYAATLALAPVVDEIVEDSACDLLFDLENVTLIDSEGIKMLLAVLEQLRRQQRNGEVVRRSKQVDRIMTLAGVQELFADPGVAAHHSAERSFWRLG